MSEKLLTIAVPTYNRVDTLQLLLATLFDEIHGLEHLVEVIVSDNASNDSTSQVLAMFKLKWSALIVVQHENNLGAEENFCQCFDRANAKYFWLVGDDDLPKKGVVRRIVDLIHEEAPDLVHMASEWSKRITSSSQGLPIGELNYLQMERHDFTRCVNIWLTFISGVVVNRALLVELDEIRSIRRFMGSYLVQLGWVFALLKNGKKFIYVFDPCILAKGGNSGGYALVTVFGKKYTEIVCDVFGFGSDCAEILIKRNLLGFLPRLIWASRFSNIDKYHAEDFLFTIRPYFKRYLSLWLILVSIGMAPKLVALAFLALSIVGFKFWHIIDLLRATLGGYRLLFLSRCP